MNRQTRTRRGSDLGSDVGIFWRIRRFFVFFLSALVELQVEAGLVDDGPTADYELGPGVVAPEQAVAALELLRLRQVPPAVRPVCVDRHQGWFAGRQPDGHWVFC